MKNIVHRLGILLLTGLFAVFISCKSHEVVCEAEPLALLALDDNFDMTSEYIVVIGDIQEYTANPDLMPYYEATVQWIYSQYMQGMDIKCVLQVGDLTTGNQENCYQSFYNVTSMLAEEIPYVACIGNHDYAWDENGKIKDRDATFFSHYAAFPLMETAIVDRFEEGRIENVVVENYIDGYPYYILALEFGPREEVVNWANHYVRNHKSRKFILMTHEYLTQSGERISDKSDAEAQFLNTTYSTPEMLWEQLVKYNDNIAWVLCGHNGFYSHRMSMNAYGRDVLQVLFNLQYQRNGGDGMIQLWEFPQEQDTATVRIYNTINRQWLTEENEVVELKFRYKY